MRSWLPDLTERNATVGFEPPVCGDLLKRPLDTRRHLERPVRRKAALRAGGRPRGGGRGCPSSTSLPSSGLGEKYKQIEKQLGFAFTVGSFHEEDARASTSRRRGLTWEKYDLVTWAIMLVPAKPKRPRPPRSRPGEPAANREAAR